MIVIEHLEINGRQYVRTYSDAGMLIHGGFPEADYEEAIEPAEYGRVYTETDIPIGGDDEISMEEAFDLMEGII